MHIHQFTNTPSDTKEYKNLS